MGVSRIFAAFRQKSMSYSDQKLSKLYELASQAQATLARSFVSEQNLGARFATSYGTKSAN